MSGHQPDKEFLQKIIHKAGMATLEYFQKSFSIKEKPDNQGVVTDADFASEDIIKKEIHSTFPDHNILAEESGMTMFSSSNSENLPIWIIDPLDGTTNFSKGNPYYCISIAYGKSTKGRFSPQLAAVFQPTTHSLYFAEKNKGAYLNSTPISVSNSKDFHLASIATGFSSNKEQSLLPLTKTIAAIQNKSLGLRINGAAALDLAHTARGIFQGFYETPLSPWDTAAGALLIQEAGGKVTNYAGNEFCPLNDKGIIAANKFLFHDLFETIKNNYI